MSFVLMVFSSVFISCKKEVEQNGLQATRDRHENFCSTQRDSDLIMKVRFDTPLMSKEQLISILKNGIERSVKQGKNYMKVSIDPDFADITLHFYKFNDERSDLRSRHQQPKALDTDKQLRTKVAGTATVVAHTLAILKRSIVTHPELYLSCEMELEIIEWDGVYYLEDCC